MLDKLSSKTRVLGYGAIILGVGKIILDTASTYIPGPLAVWKANAIGYLSGIGTNIPGGILVFAIYLVIKFFKNNK